MQLEPERGVGVVIAKAVQNNKTVVPASIVKTNPDLGVRVERNSAVSSVNVWATLLHNPLRYSVTAKLHSTR